MTVLLLRPVIGSCTVFIFMNYLTAALCSFVVFQCEYMLACVLLTAQLWLAEAPEKVKQQSNQTE